MTSTDEWWTQRQATEYLQRLHLGRDAARSALQAGIAGRPVRMRHGLLYPAEAVRAAWDRAGEPCTILARTARPVFVARIAPREPDPHSAWRDWRGADVTATVVEQRDAARAWWYLGPRMAALASGLGARGGMPFVVTCGGIIVMGAEILAIDEALNDEAAVRSAERSAGAKGAYTRDAVAFTLGEPGEWFDGQWGRRWQTGAGGPFRLVHGRARARPSMDP